MPDENVNEEIQNNTEEVVDNEATEEVVADESTKTVEQNEESPALDISAMSDEEFAELDIDVVLDKETEKAEKAEEQEVEENSDTTTNEINTEDFYETLTKPLKVNGVEIRFDDPEEIRTLISRGIGSNKRMQELKPTVILKKTLEEHGLDTPEKVNFMIDVMEGNPEALSKFLADKNIDPFDLALEEADDYVPNDNMATESSVILDEVISTIQETPENEKVSEIINSLPETDITLIQNDPSILTDLHQHVKTGEYDRVMAEVEKQRIYGQLPPNISTLQAYANVYMQSQQGTQQKSQQSTEQAAQNTLQPNTQKRVAAAKAAVASNRNVGTTTSKPKMLDISKMSDEEFEKLDLEQIEALSH